MKQSLRTRWMRLSILIITGSFILFSTFLIYATSIYLKDLEYRSADRSVKEMKMLYETTPINNISEREIYSNLFDNQRFILFTANGDEVYQWPVRGEALFKLTEEEITNGSTVTREFDGEKYLVSTERVQSNYWNGYIAVIHPLKEYYTVLQMIVIIATLVGFISISFTSVISFFFSGQMVRPIRRFTKQLQDVENNGFSERLNLTTNIEEIDLMVESFNTMMTALESSYNSQKQFVEDASHELRTPLQIVQGHLNLINRWGKNNPDVLEESLDISIVELNRIQKLVEELLQLTKSEKTEPLELTEFDVNEDIKARIEAMKKIHPDYTFILNLSKKPIYLKMSQYQFEQILIIFLDNAIKYDTINKTIKVSTFLDKYKHRHITIRDSGIGIPVEEQEKVFNRFYRVDKSRSREQGGNGLGLSIAEKIIEANNGSVKIESVEGDHTTIHISFPPR